MGYVSHPDGVDADYIKSGRFEIAIAGQRYAARASLRPMYDPTSARMKA
jgi:4-methylaminobutanoate oxidase (formaldehyde-forming)